MTTASGRHGKEHMHHLFEKKKRRVDWKFVPGKKEGSGKATPGPAPSSSARKKTSFLSDYVVSEEIAGGGKDTARSFN